VRPVPVTGFTQPLQINDFTTLYMLPLIPLHFLCTHFLQLESRDFKFCTLVDHVKY